VVHRVHVIDEDLRAADADHHDHVLPELDRAAVGDPRVAGLVEGRAAMVLPAFPRTMTGVEEVPMCARPWAPLKGLNWSPSFAPVNVPVGVGMVTPRKRASPASNRVLPTS
jgi:hypothetical protein